MPTYAQLQAESWWGREIVTPELAWLGDQLCASLGVPRGNFGCKGDNRHLNGGHRSQEWIKNSRYCTNRTYATEAGLTAEQARHLSAWDITPGNRRQMLFLSRNVDRATRAGELEELVEWFGNTNDDQRVDGWNNIKDAVASSDPSHLWHLHGRFRRTVLRDQAVMHRTLTALTGGKPMTEYHQENTFATLLKGGSSCGPADQVPAQYRGDSDAQGNAVVSQLTYQTALLKQLVDRPAGAATLTDAQVATLALKVGEQLVAAVDNPLGEADKPAIVAAVQQALRAGVGADPD